MATLVHARPSLALAVFLCLSGAAAFGQTTAELAAGLTIPRPDPACGVVFAVDGSAGLRHIGDDLREAVCQAHLSLEVRDFPWSNGNGRVLADLRWREHHQAKGKELADLVLAQRRACPASKIYLVCHSSGAAVVLAAAECLPPGTVDRVVLLAPAVSPYYDLRPALACTREGIDCYSSWCDLTSCALTLVGTTDGYHLPSAGCLGFIPTADAPGDWTYQNLRQHGWSARMMSVGDFGGHYGCTRLGFFQEYVAPLLTDGGDRR